ECQMWFQASTHGPKFCEKFIRHEKQEHGYHKMKSKLCPTCMRFFAEYSHLLIHAQYTSTCPVSFRDVYKESKRLTRCHLEEEARRIALEEAEEKERQRVEAERQARERERREQEMLRLEAERVGRERERQKKEAKERQRLEAERLAKGRERQEKQEGSGSLADKYVRRQEAAVARAATFQNTASRSSGSVV
ncbi:hypothetical protein KIPB_013347, partial [Kipferlia bialata]